MSIISAIKKYTQLAKGRWHTPGHKGKLDTLDITEIADGEFFPGNLVELAQIKTANFYNAKHLRYLTNGSSQGIKAFMLAVGGAVIVSSHAHMAFEQGANLSKNPIYYMDTGFDSDLISTLPTKQDVLKAIADHPDAVAFAIESPDYCGRVVKQEVIDCIKNAGLIVYCDSAHGAHFDACKHLKHLSYVSKCDACNLSAHKTLFAPTQTAYLCVNNEELLPKIDEALLNLSTTSPSYTFLASLESALDNDKASQEMYQTLYENVNEFKKQVECKSNDDYSRILVDAVHYGLTPQDLASQLQNAGIFIETIKGNYVIFIATPFDSKQDFDFLANQIIKIHARTRK